MRTLISASLIAIGAGLSILADIFLKQGGLSKPSHLIAGAILYGSVALPVALAFKYTEFGRLFLIWEAMVIVGGLIIASIYFKESFSIYKVLALVFALVSLWFSYK
jgi:multidrug transporter EmrE-like cation transporter